MVTRVQDKT